MVARILVAVLLSLAGAPVAAETYLEFIRRLEGEALALQRQYADEASATTADTSGRVLAFKKQYMQLSKKDRGSMATLCESERHGLMVLNEVLNGPLAQIQTTGAKNLRALVTYRLHTSFVLALLLHIDPTTGTLDFDLDDFDALSPADWSARIGDLGWGEHCLMSDYDEESLGCATGKRPLLTLFIGFRPVLYRLGLLEDSYLLQAAAETGQYAFNELCGFSQDE